MAFRFSAAFQPLLYFVYILCFLGHFSALKQNKTQKKDDDDDDDEDNKNNNKNKT